MTTWNCLCPISVLSAAECHRHCARDSQPQYRYRRMLSFGVLAGAGDLSEPTAWSIGDVVVRKSITSPRTARLVVSTPLSPYARCSCGVIQTASRIVSHSHRRHHHGFSSSCGGHGESEIGCGRHVTAGRSHWSAAQMRVSVLWVSPSC